MNKLLVVTLLAGVFVSACGGGDGGSANAETPVSDDLTQAEIEVKFNLPPEPDPEVNNATIEGVDSNGVRGRDDVERAITFEYYKDEEKLGHLYSLLEAERTVSIAFQGQNETEREAAFAEVSKLNTCYIFSYREKGGRDLKIMDSLLDNIPERILFTLSIRGEQGGSVKEIIEDCKSRGFTNMPM